MIGFSSEYIFTELISFSMAVVYGNVNDEIEYIGELYDPLSGVGNDFIICMTLVLK